MGNISNSSYYRSYSPTPSTASMVKVEEGTNFSIWKDSSGNHFQQRIISLLTNNQVQQQLHIYELRKNNNFNLVAVHSAQAINKKVQITNCKQLKILTQRILCTLDQTYAITTQQGLSILNQAALGFQCLYKHVGYFQINDYLIGFNDNRQIRVWLNSNWALNSKMQNNYKQPFGDIEHIMVIRMIEVIEMHIEKSPFLGMFIQRRKSCLSWTFRKLVQFIEKFTIDKKLKLTKACHLNIDISKTKVEQKYTKTILNFKIKGKSPTYQNYTQKSSTVHNSLLNNAQRTNFSNAHSGQKQSDFQQGSIALKTKMPECINFKSNRQLSNITNQITFTTRFQNNVVHFREKRMSEHIIPIQNARNKMFTKHRRLSSHSIQYADQRKKMAISARDTFKLYSSKGIQQNQQNSSLDKIRKQLRGFLGGLTEQDMRTSCPALQPYHTEGNFLRQSASPVGQLQFRLTQLRKNKIQTLHIKTQQDEKKDSSPFNLQFGFKKEKAKLNFQSITPHSKQQPILNNPSHQNTISIQSVSINKPTLKFYKHNSNSEPTSDETIRSTLPNAKSIQNSMLAKTASKQGQSSITTFSKTKQLKQSFIIPEDTEQGNISQRNLQQRFVGFQSLKLKKPLTRSINLPATTTQNDKQSDEDNVKKPLSMLDMMIIKRNLLKQKKNQEQLDVSVDESLTMSIKKQQLETFK